MPAILPLRDSGTAMSAKTHSPLIAYQRNILFLLLFSFMFTVNANGRVLCIHPDGSMAINVRVDQHGCCDELVARSDTDVVTEPLVSIANCCSDVQLVTTDSSLTIPNAEPIAPNIDVSVNHVVSSSPIPACRPMSYEIIRAPNPPPALKRLKTVIILV